MTFFFGFLSIFTPVFSLASSLNVSEIRELVAAIKVIQFFPLFFG